MLSNNHFKVKCPNCNRHLDEIKGDNLEVLRKCKSCKNNIRTIVRDGIINNKIDTKENALDIINGSTGAFRKK